MKGSFSVSLDGGNNALDPVRKRYILRVRVFPFYRRNCMIDE
jgi:hypothetical protein